MGPHYQHNPAPIVSHGDTRVSITQGTDRQTTFVYDGKKRRRVPREETKGSSKQLMAHQGRCFDQLMESTTGTSNECRENQLRFEALPLLRRTCYYDAWRLRNLRRV